ncbi:MAG: NTP transferase domain-containing protein [Chloroflexi bacterium]|nr:NTP transferase domain-containing protein [Chloroflexota bacterium]MCH8340901.1 NTP transferase domain-containing protein [Chloroflexota bacterium]MDK1045423.1 NTP transferase domain-containing protein [Anaerolineales bacterium]
MDYTLIVAAAGQGLRLREISQGISKPLALIAGRPILGWALATLESNPPDRAVVVATSESLPAAQELAALELPDTDIVGVVQPAPLGTLDALRSGLTAAVAEASGTNVAFLHGDNIPPSGLIDRGAAALKERGATFFSRRTRNPGSSAKLVRESGGRPIALTDAEPWAAEAEVEIVGGLFLYGPWIWERFGGDQPAREGETEINSFNDELLRAGIANVVSVKETWLHINTPSDFQEAESVLLAAR